MLNLTFFSAPKPNPTILATSGRSPSVRVVAAMVPATKTITVSGVASP